MSFEAITEIPYAILCIEDKIRFEVKLAISHRLLNVGSIRS
jgi:hypothetical protein